MTSLRRATTGAVRGYRAQLRSFLEREGLYPLSYLLVPATFVLVFGPVALLPLAAPLTLLACALYLPSYWLAGAALQRLVVVQSAWAALASLLVPAAIYLHFLPIFAAARLNTRRAFLLALAGVLLVATLNLNLLYALGRLEPTVWWFMLALGGFMGWAGRFEVARERTSARLKLAEADARRLGASAERERIARDLHDLLGQSLSLIAVKAELTKKLAPSDLERALRENEDVVHIAKKTLAEVRQAVTSYRAPTLEDELVNADLALRSVGGTLEADLAPAALTDDQEAALAFVLREGVTNVVRHAAASRCWVRLRSAAKEVVFTVEDNGRGGGGAGGKATEGGGLQGMRARVEALGGTLERTSERGTRLTVRLPLGSAQRGSRRV